MSGVRAWAFVSPDSNYDVCFLFANPEDIYVTVKDGSELIDLLP